MSSVYSVVHSERISKMPFSRSCYSVVYSKGFDEISPSLLKKTSLLAENVFPINTPPSKRLKITAVTSEEPCEKATTLFQNEFHPASPDCKADLWTGFSDDEWNQIKNRITRILHPQMTCDKFLMRDRVVCEAFFYYHIHSCNKTKALGRFKLSHSVFNYYYSRFIESGIIFAIAFVYFPHIGKTLKYRFGENDLALSSSFECSLTPEEKTASHIGLEKYISIRDHLQSKIELKRNSFAANGAVWTGFSDDEWSSIQNRMFWILHPNKRHLPRIDRDRAICESFLYYFMHDCSLKEAMKSNLSMKLLWNYYDRLVKGGIIFAIAFVYFPHIGKALKYRFEGPRRPLLTSDFTFMECRLTPEEKNWCRLGLEQYLSIRDQLEVKPAGGKIPSSKQQSVTPHSQPSTQQSVTPHSQPQSQSLSIQDFFAGEDLLFDGYSDL